MRHAAETLDELGVPHEERVVSAHRTPDLLFEYAESAEERGLQVLIAGAGGAAHLPGMAAAKTALPVLGVPVESKALKGMDSLLSIVQMPAGVPVGTLAIGRAGAVNAALLAAAIVARSDEGVRERLARFRAAQTEAVLAAPTRQVTDCYLAPVGIIGGGQLGRMLALAGIPLGLRSASSIRRPTRRPAQWGSCSSATTTIRRCSTGSPRASTLSPTSSRTSRSRRRGASGRVPGAGGARGRAGPAGREAALPPARHPDGARIDDEVETFPAILKTRRLGYDGKGQRLVETRPGTVPGHVLEDVVPFDRELSLLAVRGRDGETAFYPLVENVHEDGILRSSRAPRRGRAAGARPRITRRGCSTSSAMSASSRSSSSTSATGCSRTSWRRASTTPATGRSRARRRASSRTTCARSSACRSDRRRCAAKSCC